MDNHRLPDDPIHILYLFFSYMFLQLKVSTGLIYSLICLTYTVGWRVVLMFILHTIVTFLASRSRNTVVVWAVMLVQIAAINFQMFKTYQVCVTKVYIDSCL